MAKVYIRCDICKIETENWDEFKLRGYTCDDFHVDYWEGDICFHCQYKMRKALDFPCYKTSKEQQ